MKKFEVRRFGSFWAGDLTRTDDRPALYTKNNILRFGDSTVDESVNIPWVWVGDKWISKATVLTNITWNELDAFGFTRGPASPYRWGPVLLPVPAPGCQP